jgi:hypothetical protein
MASRDELTVNRAVAPNVGNREVTQLNALKIDSECVRPVALELPVRTADPSVLVPGSLWVDGDDLKFVNASGAVTTVANV